MSRKLIDAALLNVRHRFIASTVARLEKDSTEHDLVMYRMKSLFDNTVLGGKNARSLLCLSSFDAFRPDTNEEDRMRAAEVAATLEMVQGFYLIADDLMDGSDTRRGKPCWYKRSNIGTSAINDAFLLDSFTEEVLRDLLLSHPQGDSICSAYRRSKRHTIIGQLLDAETQHNIDAFSWDRYEQIVQHKTSHYTFFNPVENAMLLCDLQSGHSKVRQLAYQIGFLFQSQDDVLDVFGDPSVTGKVGTDLRDGKCTWVTVRTAQKLGQNVGLAEKFKKNFGKEDKSSCNIVKEIIDDLRISKEFSVFESRFSQKIMEDMQQLPSSVSPLIPVLQDAVSSIVKRKK